MTLKEILTRSFTWWNGQTWGTYLYTRRKGELVGRDEFGNTYYRRIGRTFDPSIGPERRWVIYNGEVEASKVPPGWRGWLTYTYSTPPSEQDYQPREWEKGHERNLTGTPLAYRPQGSTLAKAERPPATGDYVAWSPDGWAPGPDKDGRAGPTGDVPNAMSHPGTHGANLASQNHSG